MKTNKDYVDLLNFENEDLLIDEIFKVLAQNNKVSVIGKVDLINYIFITLIENGFNVGKVNIENQGSGLIYILVIDDYNVYVEPVECYDYGLFKASDGLMFVDIENVDIITINHCIDSNRRIQLFGFGIQEIMEDAKKRDTTKQEEKKVDTKCHFDVDADVILAICKDYARELQKIQNEQRMFELNQIGMLRLRDLLREGLL